jgi:hypothetical protein
MGPSTAAMISASVMARGDFESAYPPCTPRCETRSPDRAKSFAVLFTMGGDTPVSRASSEVESSVVSARAAKRLMSRMA